MTTSNPGQDVVRELIRALMSEIDVDVDADLRLVRAKAASVRSASVATTQEPGWADVHRGQGRTSAIRRFRPVAILALVGLLVVGGAAALTAIGGDATLTVTVVSGAMAPTLEIGQQVAVDPDAYESTIPERGDIIAFTLPDHPDIIAIKRVIGLPGDVIEQVRGVVYVNGVALDEPYTSPDTGTLGPWSVTADHVFVMGDNRPTSNDSRYSMGQVAAVGIVGKVVLDQEAEDRSLPVPPAPVVTRTP